MRVLIGTDGSDEAVDAARRAVPLLAPATSVVLVCVIDGVDLEAGFESGFGGGTVTPEEAEAARSELSDAATAALDRTVAALPASTPVERRIEHGEPGEVICRLAQELPADVVVVASRGRGRLRRALLGSVSTHVANNVQCPVVIVRSAE